MSHENRVGYMRIMDCPAKGELHDWCTERIKGTFEGWGHGTMKQRRCGKCQTINFIEFTHRDGRYTDIRKKFGLPPIKDAPKVLTPLGYYKG